MTTDPARWRTALVALALLAAGGCRDARDSVGADRPGAVPDRGAGGPDAGSPGTSTAERANVEKAK